MEATEGKEAAGKTPTILTQGEKEEDASYSSEISAHVRGLPPPIADLIGAYATSKGQRVVFPPTLQHKVLWCARLESTRADGTVVVDPGFVPSALPADLLKDNSSVFHMAAREDGTALMFRSESDHDNVIDPDIVHPSPAILPVRNMGMSHLWQWRPWHEARAEAWRKLWPLPVCVSAPIYPIEGVVVLNECLYVLVFSKGIPAAGAEHSERTLFRCNLATGEWTALPLVPGLDQFCYQCRGTLCVHNGALAVTMGSWWTIWSEAKKAWQTSEQVAELNYDVKSLNTDFYLSTGARHAGKPDGVYYICNERSSGLWIEFIPDTACDNQGSERVADADETEHTPSPVPDASASSESTHAGWCREVKGDSKRRVLGCVVMHGSLHVFYSQRSLAGALQVYCLVFDDLGKFTQSPPVAFDTCPTFLTASLLL